MGEEGEVVDVRWDWSDEHDLHDTAALEGWSEAGFGFSGVRGRKKTRASFTAADLSRPRGRILEYQDPWATDDDDEDPSRSWGVD